VAQKHVPHRLQHQRLRERVPRHHSDDYERAYPHDRTQGRPSGELGVTPKNLGRPHLAEPGEYLRRRLPLLHGVQEQGFEYRWRGAVGAVLGDCGRAVIDIEKLIGGECMGHERIGFLPRTKQWNAIVEQLSMFGGNITSIIKITDDTLTAIRKTYEAMPYDESVVKAVSYLAMLAFSAKQPEQTAFLNENGYVVDAKMSLFSLIESAQKYIQTENGSLEVNKIAKDAAMQAIITYHESHQTKQLSLFEEEADNVWKAAGSGAAFCELARNFFAAFTDRQIRYYIERAAASAINDYGELQSFSTILSVQSNAIADHAFETSKIMQSFAAGWFNKHVNSSALSSIDVTNFLRMSFGKMREEFRREATTQ